MILPRRFPTRRQRLIRRPHPHRHLLPRLPSSLWRSGTCYHLPNGVPQFLLCPVLWCPGCFQKLVPSGWLHVFPLICSLLLFTLVSLLHSGTSEWMACKTNLKEKIRSRWRSCFGQFRAEKRKPSAAPSAPLQLTHVFNLKTQVIPPLFRGSLSFCLIPTCPNFKLFLCY